MSVANQSQPSVSQIFAIEHQLIRLCSSFGLKLIPARPELRNFLNHAPLEMIDHLNKTLANLTTNLAVCSEMDIDPWDDTEFFKLSMRSLGFTFPGDFLGTVRSGDLIEGYDMNRRQIFRNMRFMEMSNYSLLEALSYEWPELFDRASAITDKMITYCDDILWTANHTIPFDVPKHFIRELRTEQRQFFEIEFKYISPLFSGPNQPAGLLGTFRCRPVELDQRQDTLAFL